MVLKFCSFFILILAVFICSGCAGVMPGLKPVTNEERAMILSGAPLFPDEYMDLKLPEDRVFEMTPDMKAFAINAINGATSEERKIFRLLKAITSPEHMGLQFNDSETYTAAEAFHNRSANCLSFTAMIIPMLRYLDIQADFNDVEVPPFWDLQNNDILVLYRHINAIVTKQDRNPQVIDINMTEYESYYSQNIIPDHTAEAHYYNNRSIEHLLEGNITDAFRYVRKAITLDPAVPYFWINLAAIYRNQGRIEAAEIAIRAALETDSKDPAAISKAARIYRELGKPELAAYFTKRTNNYRQRNPYYHYYVAMKAFLEHDYDSAMDNIQYSIKHYPDEHRFYFLQGAIYKSTGREELATRSMDRALELTTNQKQLDRYRRKLEMIM